MELHDYPRPANDTGIGVHWAAGYASVTGLARIRESWIPEMKALGVKWVKLYNHDGALDLAELLLTEGFMPIVRLYRPNPNPGRLGVKEIVYLESLIRAGVSYFEFNNEPDKPGEWKGGRLPANALEIVAENAIADMETILERGAMPAIPAVSGSSSWDIVGRIVEMGRRDLFDGPVWQAIHNYPRNRPLDYPYDIGNQEGSAYTDRFYRVVAEEEWGEHAWRGRSLVDVNRLRLGRANPGVSLADDHDCWLSFRHYDDQNQRHLGRSIPVLSTESGYLVGEDLDPRYPATTPDLHMAQTLEACRIMMGGSRRFDAAPDYYFCTSFWLLANRELGSSSDWWEGHAWYSDRWQGGVLPVVRALRAEPKTVRRWQTTPSTAAKIAVHGFVSQAEEQEIVIVEQDGREAARAAVGAAGRYHVDDLPPGSYQLRLASSQVSQEVTLAPDQQHVIVNFELNSQGAGLSNSVVHGVVAGGAGAVVLLTRRSDGEEWVTLAHEDGRFRFVGLPAGLFEARVHGQGSYVADITLDGRNEAEVQLMAGGWGYTIRRLDDEPSAYTGAICCIVEGRKGLTVYAEQGAWRSESMRTGNAPERGPYAAVLAPMDAGDYSIHVDDPDGDGEEALHLDAQVHVDRKRLPVLTFVYNEVTVEERPQQSAIRVNVNMLDAVSGLAVALADGQDQRTVLPVDDNHSVRFNGLAEGIYAVEVVGYEEAAGQADIVVDGISEVAVELWLPTDPNAGTLDMARSRIEGTAPQAVGSLATLVDQVGNEFTRVVDEQNGFRFDHLPPGIYTLRVEGGYLQEDIGVNGSDGVEIAFSPLVRAWYAEQSNAGAMPGFSTLRVEVEGKTDQPVYIWQDDGVSMVRQTGASDGLSADVAEFRPLDAGIYLVEPEGLDVRAEVELTGLETVWISFHERFEPAEPNQVRTLDESDLEESVWEAADDGNRIEASGDTYVFLGDGDICTDHVAALVTFVALHQPRMGKDIDEAAKADRVLLIGEIEPETRSLLELQVAKVEQLAISDL